MTEVPPSNDEPLDLPSALRQFTNAWREKQIPEIDDYWPQDYSEHSAEEYYQGLVEFVAHDLMYRWKMAEGASTVPAEHPRQAAHYRWKLEEYTQRYPALGETDDLSVRLIETEYRVRHLWGDRPQHEEYIRRFPQKGPSLDLYLDRIDAVLQQAQEQNQEAQFVTESDRDLTGFDDYPTLLPITPTSAWPAIPGYEILAELGRGGGGVVYKAWQTGLKRMVALKMPSTQGLTQQQLKRFIREAQAIARIDHTNIVTIYEIQQYEGKPYFSMEHVDGGTLEEDLNAREDPMDPIEAAQLLLTLAQAMSVAHRQKKIHRDLKPLNILLTQDKSPRIADFGLVKDMDEAAITQAKTVMGTPDYMAPEQAKGMNQEVCFATDVHALGGILYRCITGSKPFVAETTSDVMRKVMHEIPVPPRKHLNKAGTKLPPRDLEKICLACLEKDPKDRYRDASMLAEDLRRFLNHEPLRFRPPYFWKRGAMWVRRRPMTAIFSLLLLGAFLVYYVVLWNQKEEAKAIARHAKANEEKAIIAQKEAVDAKRDAESSLYFFQIAQAHYEWYANNQPRALELLESCQKAEQRDWEWDYLNRLCRPEVLILENVEARCVASDSKGTYVASGCQNGKVQVWSLTDGKLFKETATLGQVNSIAFHPTDLTIAFGCEDGTVHVWDLTMNQVHTGNQAHSQAVTRVQFHPRGHQIASGSKDFNVVIWNATNLTRERALVPKKTSSIISDLSYSPNGNWLVAGREDGTLMVWEVEKFYKQTAEFGTRQTEPNRKPVVGVTFIPASNPQYRENGAAIYTTHRTGVLQAWDFIEQKRFYQAETNSEHPLCRMVFFDTRASGRAKSRFAYAKEDALILTAREGLPRVLAGHSGKIRDIAVIPKGNPALLVACDDSGSVLVWDSSFARDREANLLKDPMSSLFRDLPQTVPRKAMILESGIQILDEAKPEQNLLLQDSRGWGEGTFNVSRSLYAARRKGPQTEDPEIRFWDVSSGRILHTGTAPQKITCIESYSNTQFAAGGREGEMYLWKAGQKGRATSKKHRMSVECLAFSPDGKTLLSGDNDGKMLLWTTPSLKAKVEARAYAKSPITHLGFSPNGHRLVSVSKGLFGAKMKIWDARSGREILTLPTDRIPEFR